MACDFNKIIAVYIHTSVNFLSLFYLFNFIEKKSKKNILHNHLVI